MYSIRYVESKDTKGVEKITVKEIPLLPIGSHKIGKDLIIIEEGHSNENMLEGIIYDGVNPLTDGYNINQINEKNKELLKTPAKLRSFFTSGVLYFGVKLLKALNSLQAERDKAQQNLDAMQLVQIQQGTDTHVVSSCIYASH